MEKGQCSENQQPCGEKELLLMEEVEQIRPDLQQNIRFIHVRNTGFRKRLISYYSLKFFCPCKFRALDLGHTYGAVMTHRINPTLMVDMSRMHFCAPLDD